MKKLFVEDLQDVDGGEEPQDAKADQALTSTVSKQAGKGTSPDGTTVPPAAQLVDANGACWTLSTDVEHGGNLVLRDVTRVPGAGVRLTLVAGSVYLQNAPGAWFVWAGNTWVVTSDPFI